MECTQRLEYSHTQDLEFPQEKECPEQIGFLGICGKTYPVKKGPNKIGRDPQTCNIVLNLNSISRQHAVINVLHKNEFMLMDLDSANKTKLAGKSLQPYVPAPLRNGDTVQFGDIFGIFRLLQEDYDLPMTQALDIPDTPLPTRHMSKLNMVTTVPESPDVSDKDDSFILSSQPKNQHFKETGNHHFIKPGKTISIQPIGSKKIDNVYWKSSKKSLSINLDESNDSLNSSKPSIEPNKKENEENIYEMETQPPCLSKANESIDSIYSANTQMPVDNTIHTAETQAFVPGPSSPSIHTAETQAFGPRYSSPSIHTANTQMPSELPSPSIHSLETQLPEDKLPEELETEKEEIQYDLYADNKENDNSIYNAKTQCFLPQKENSRLSNDKSKSNTSDENILFDEVDHKSFDEPFESQTILTEDILLPNNKCLEEPEPDIPQSQIIVPQSCKRNNRINSNDSTDCEDINILPTQKISEVKPTEDDETDCEEEIIELTENKILKLQLNDSVIEFQDLATQVLTVNDSPPQNKNVDFEDMLTQVIAPEKDAIKEVLKQDVDFEDLPTQVIKEVDQQFSEELISPFKIPIKSAVKAKKKDTPKTPKIKLMTPPGVQNKDDEKYYQDTQDIFDDLCTQRIPSPETAMPVKSFSKIGSTESVQKVSCESPNMDKQLENKFVVDKSPSLSDSEAKSNEFVSNLSSQEVRNIIGVEKDVAKLRRTGSDSSDLERTPRKVRPFKFMDIDLPNSQEIKTTVSQCSKTLVTESSSDSESENNSESQCTPILFHKKKKKPKADAKIDLIKKFNAEALPTRVITRVRKPTAKLMDSESRKKAENILKPTFLTEQDDNIDREIISENISRLKNKNDKSKNAKDDSGIDIRTDPDKSEGIADVVKRDRSKRNENKPDKSVKDSAITTETKHRTYKNTKNNKVLEDTSTTDKINDTNEPLDSTTTSKRRGRTARNKTNKTDDETEPENPIQKRKYTNKDTKNDKNQKKTPLPENSKVDLTTEIEKSKPKRKYTKKDTKIEQDTSKTEKDPKRTRKDPMKTENDTISTTKDPTKTEKDTRRTRKEPTNTEKATTTAGKDTTKTRKETTKTEKEKAPSPEKEVRRSRRQKTVAKKPDIPIKSILKNSISTLEHSTVYNLSTESNYDSITPLKRPAEATISEPVSKRTRLRATPARMGNTQHVLFTAFPYEEVKVKLEKLGAVVVTDVMKSTVILTQQIKRTFKLLCAVGLGKPIVGPSWVQACADNNTVVDPWLYIIKDEAAEKRFNFSLEKTLIGKRNFLHGYNLSSTPSVLPNATEMKLIVECSGGTWKAGASTKGKWICISSPPDRQLWPDLREKGAIIVSTEFILGGVLRQTVDIEGNLLR